MELTIDQALQTGIEAHKAGQVQEADRLYTAILKAQPKHPDANHNIGVLAVGVGKVQEDYSPAQLRCSAEGTPPCGPMDKPKPNKMAHFYSGQIQPNGALLLRRLVQF
jgi:hypothetical protein